VHSTETLEVPITMQSGQNAIDKMHSLLSKITSIRRSLNSGLFGESGDGAVGYPVGDVFLRDAGKCGQDGAGVRAGRGGVVG
jgi:hypothetical protein